MSTNTFSALAALNELIRTLDEHIAAQNQDDCKQQALNNDLSFERCANLIEYKDSYFDDYVPDGRFISGTFDIEQDWIIVYQAFNRNIAEYAVKQQRFLGNTKFYSKSRMTWIKPNFLWMMYRANWAQKDQNQTNILAIFLKLSGNGFINLVKHSNRSKGAVDRVSLQWDPHHLPNGGKIVTKRAIQLGLKGSCSIDSFHASIVRIEDITPFVSEQYNRMQSNQPFLVPLERTLDITQIAGDNKLDESDMRRIKLHEPWR